mgnify:CR=1 FL=1
MAGRQLLDIASLYERHAEPLLVFFTRRTFDPQAATDLWAGTLLTESAVADSLVPGEGESLVGISLTPAQMPSESLYSGDAR